ncbi:gluconate 2-dehydrogenase subunit 3 family protein [Parapedobacter sp. 10938]|uniref:gluconate 2-dehydrogenase subunit 3 family protein n=1 Tax=Parapedobacter flavus TaxID=3110225 RepID=UPI002DBA8E45|nr:gluconate 2-dehydrogenase subunit 3 family protein [Parapedobacter sp. 10938]MEC3878969.1 gluconate 2-dehydrogenase subunit 3 family protein [Parapedobacter sp. 10938]
MDRRSAIKTTAILMGGAVSPLGLSVFINGCTQETGYESVGAFSPHQVGMLVEIADIIIPETEIPGAKSAQVGPVMARIISDCYPDRVLQDFFAGFAEFERQARQRFRKDFSKLEIAERAQWLQEWRAQVLEEETEKAKQNLLFFAMVRDLTILCYTTSEIGSTQLLEYIPVPGRFDGCMDYKEEDKRYVI